MSRFRLYPCVNSVRSYIMIAMRWARTVSALLLWLLLFRAAAQQRIDPSVIFGPPPPDPIGLARQPLAPEILLLSRIKVRAAENLQRLPNYTCTETIERSRRARKSRRFDPVDTLRLEV